MIKLGTHVHWLRGDHVAGGTAAERLVGDLDVPQHVVVTTIIVRTDGGGVEMVPEWALSEDAPPAEAPEAPPPTRATRSRRPDACQRRDLFLRCRPLMSAARREDPEDDPREGVPGRLTP